MQAASLCPGQWRQTARRKLNFGSLAPLSSSPPTLVATIPYSSLGAAGTNTFFNYKGVFSRNARRKAIAVLSNINNGSNGLSTPQGALYDSSWQLISQNGQTYNIYTSFPNSESLYGVLDGTLWWYGSEDVLSPNPNLMNQPWDSFSLALQIATANATTGNAYVYAWSET